MDTAEDFEMDTSLSHVSIRVGVRDENNASAEEIFQVQVMHDDETEPVEPTDPFLFDANELVIEENLPAGSKVGQFFVTGGISDDTEVEYSLNSNADIFEIDENGTLLTRIILDYEEFNLEEIMVEVLAKSETNHFAIRSFPVRIIDLNESETSDEQYFDFNATPLMVMENAPVGTMFGQFYPMNEDLNASYEFSIIDPNSLFEIDDLGFLRTRVELDYDRLSYYNLIIDVLGQKDGNQSKSRVFEVSLIDVNHPPEEILFEGELLVRGDDPDSFMPGKFTVTDEDESDEHEFVLVDGFGAEDNQMFEIDAYGNLHFTGEDKVAESVALSIRVRATDSARSSVETVFKVEYEMLSGDSVEMLTDGADIGAGWKRAGWFGHYFGAFYPWVHHENLGWLFVEQRGEGDIWFYRDGLGWVWTNTELFPHLYLLGRQEWTYLDRQVFPARLFDYSHMEWFELDFPYLITVSVEPKIGGSVTGGGSFYRWEKVTIEAVADEGFEFAGWTGVDENYSKEPSIELEVHQNMEIRASFTPVLKSGGDSSGSIRSLNDYADSLDNLSPEEKKAAMAKILIYGRF